ncbi:hypothetical protein HK100_005877 [Physocladia obscura]|uniref:SHSP domain-containing protein n=1 Tax=Physocladia obscura TaxID=109957 RepID=A0AAD5T896_9FUNG|nr:hypothetical protein HK100_005877 [Physocladia obscura]
MGIISFACKVGIMVYAIDWYYNHNKTPSAQTTSSSSSIADQTTPVFKIPDQSTATDTTAPIIHAVELQNGRIGLEIDLPGLSKKQLELVIPEDNQKIIILRGDKPANESVGESARKFSIKIALPSDADVSDIHAKLDNGVLKVDIGKKSFEGTRIEIE